MRFLLVASLLLACSPAKENVVQESLPPEPIIPGVKMGQLIVEKGDVNGDGKPDIWNYYKEVPDPSDPQSVKRILTKKEADLNFDGRKDITREFDEEGMLVREEADLDFDLRVDQVNFYDKGVLREKHIYHSGGDKVLMWKYFEDGKMVRMARDNSGDGKPDYCELWYAGEKLSKFGKDTNNDGECDYWENAE